MEMEALTLGWSRRRHWLTIQSRNKKGSGFRVVAHNLLKVLEKGYLTNLFRKYCSINEMGSTGSPIRLRSYVHLS